MYVCTGRVATSLWSAEARFTLMGGQIAASCSQMLKKTIAIVSKQKIHCYNNKEDYWFLIHKFCIMFLFKVSFKIRKAAHVFKSSHES